MPQLRDGGEEDGASSAAEAQSGQVPQLRDGGDEDGASAAGTLHGTMVRRSVR